MSLGIQRSRKLDGTFQLVDALVLNLKAVSDDLDRLREQIKALEERINTIESRRLTLKHGTNRQ